MRAVAEIREFASLRTALRYVDASNTAWYYKKRKRSVLADPALAELTRSLVEKRPSYGTRRAAAQLSRTTGRSINRKRMQRLYRILDLIEPQKTKREIIRGAGRERFTPSAPNQLWAADITYISCGVDGWRYCCNIIDIFTRRCVSYVFTDSATARSVIESVLNAASTISEEEAHKLRIRSDNGVQYTSRAYKKTPGLLGIVPEYIYHNTPEQNGHVESSHKTLKREFVWPYEFGSAQEAEEQLAWAYVDYNQNRIHSALGDMTPDEYIRDWNNTVLHK